MAEESGLDGVLGEGGGQKDGKRERNLDLILDIPLKVTVATAARCSVCNRAVAPRAS